MFFVDFDWGINWFFGDNWVGVGVCFFGCCYVSVCGFCFVLFCLDGFKLFFGVFVSCECIFIGGYFYDLGWFKNGYLEWG